ncbi:MAG: arsenate reductase ArsC [Rhodospirillaceae bacterium]|nr:arsenate reductase ArsC [Rhodospirillaceae bacterium]
MGDRIFNILVLCTGNSARSILAEVLLNARGQGRLRAFSAGSHPRGQVNPDSIALLQRKGFATENLRSKSWDEFADQSAPRMDIVITVCDNAANETCPIWPGAPISAHWGLPDPAEVVGSDAARMAAFQAAYSTIEYRVRQFCTLPLDSMKPHELKRRLSEIGKKIPD